MTLRTLLLAASLLAPLAGAAQADVDQPIEIIDRSRTLPAGVLDLEGQLTIDRLATTTTTATGTTTATSTVTGVGLAAGYGFSPQLEGDLSYGFGLSPSSGTGPVGVGVAYTLLGSGPLTAAADARSGYDLASSTVLPLALGADVQLKLGSQLAVFTPGHQLSIGLSGSNPVGVHLPIGVKYQVSPQVFVAAQTEVAYIALSGGGTAVFGSDILPIEIDALYSFTHAFDVGVVLADDLKAAGDSVALGLLARAYL